MYIATIITMTDIIRSITIRQSIIKLGKGRDERDNDHQHRDGHAEFAGFR